MLPTVTHDSSAYHLQIVVGEVLDRALVNNVGTGRLSGRRRDGHGGNPASQPPSPDRRLFENVALDFNTSTMRRPESAPRGEGQGRRGIGVVILDHFMERLPVAMTGQGGIEVSDVVDIDRLGAAPGTGPSPHGDPMLMGSDRQLSMLSRIVDDCPQPRPSRARSCTEFIVTGDGKSWSGRSPGQIVTGHALQASKVFTHIGLRSRNIQPSFY